MSVFAHTLDPDLLPSPSDADLIVTHVAPSAHDPHACPCNDDPSGPCVDCRAVFEAREDGSRD